MDNIRLSVIEFAAPAVTADTAAAAPAAVVSAAVAAGGKKLGFLPSSLNNGRPFLLSEIRTSVARSPRTLSILFFELL